MTHPDHTDNVFPKWLCNGEVIVGNIGSSERAKYEIVGSAVNLTQRVQEKAQAKEIVITEYVLNHLNGNVNILKSFREN